MSKLTAAERNALPSDEFALPDRRKYPVFDDSHAANAKARATQAWNAGRITHGEYKTIERRANRQLRGK